MAKGKKASGKHEVSNGDRRSSMSTRGVGVTEADKMLRKINALKKGQDVTITLENPDKTQTNRQFIKHKVRGKAYLKYIQGGAEMKGSKNPLFAIGD
jgi:PDZ domain-containing secreted protein